MKRMNKIYTCAIVILSLLLFLIYSCKKDDIDKNSISDFDGNIYKTITISNQVWMAENLKTTKYNDGTPIPLGPDGAAWGFLKSPGYCWYNNDSTYKNTYGALYNWYTVNTGKLAPIGWHVATDADWTTLADFLGGKNVAGAKLKELGTNHWEVPNLGATNEVGFSALPGGWRSSNGNYFQIRFLGSWWTSTLNYDEVAWARNILTEDVKLISITPGGNYNCLTFGLSVRCVKD